MDTSSLDTSDEVARPWTPSYSVHSQGSPLHSPGVIEHDDPIVTYQADDQVLEVGAHELPETKFADDEQISISDELSSVEPMGVPRLNSAAKPLPGTEITDQADSNSGFEEPLDGSIIYDTSQRLEASVEVDTSFRTEETRTEANQDASSDLKHAPLPRLVSDNFTEVSPSLIPQAIVLICNCQAAAPIEPYDSPSENVHKESSTTFWVPSYSVSRQGSPVRENTKLPEVESVNILDHDYDFPLVDKPSDVLTDPKVFVEEVANVQVSRLQMTDKEIGKLSEPGAVQATLVQGSESTVEDVDPRADDLVTVTNVGENRPQVSSKTIYSIWCGSK